MTKTVHIDTLREKVARRMLDDMEDHGGLDEFCEKLQAFPERYLLHLATSALDCLALVYSAKRDHQIPTSNESLTAKE